MGRSPLCVGPIPRASIGFPPDRRRVYGRDEGFVPFGEASVSTIVVILIVIAGLKFVLFGGILWPVFKDDIRAWLHGREAKAQQPSCMYCGSVYALPADEGQVRWENEQLVLVTMYECQHCRLPFWHVERVPVGGDSARPRERI